MPEHAHRPENKRQFHAFEVYRDLGYGRTKREVARQVDASPTSIGKWAALYEWDERIAEYNVIVDEKREEGALLKIDSPIAQKAVTAMEQIEAVIDHAFIRDATGKLSPRDIKVKNVDELTRLIAEYRKFLETYHKFVAEYQPAVKEKDRGTYVKEMNVNIGNVPQEERINILKGVPSGDDAGGNKQPAGRVQEADFDDLPKQGDKD